MATTPVFLPEKCHGQKPLAGYSPRGCKSQTQVSMHASHVFYAPSPQDQTSTAHSCSWLTKSSFLSLFLLSTPVIFPAFPNKLLVSEIGTQIKTHSGGGTEHKRTVPKNLYIKYTYYSIAHHFMFCLKEAIKLHTENSLYPVPTPILFPN